MRNKMRLIAILSAMILSAGAMSVPAFANTGENTGDGSTQAAVVQTQETDGSSEESTAAGTTGESAAAGSTNPIEDITGETQPEGAIDRSVTITDNEGTAFSIPVPDVETLLTLMEKLQGKESKQTGTVVTNGDVLNVRTGSSTDYDIINQLQNGSIVEVIGEENGWYKIVIPGKTGYVCGDYLSVSSVQEELITKEELTKLLEMMMSQVGSDKQLALTPDGNLTLVDDVGKTTGAGKQFVTMVTKNGNYFYLIIDRDDKGESTVHFLNQVDERDLFSLMDEEEAAAMKEELAAEEAARQAAENPPTVTPSETEPEAQEPEPEKKGVGNMLPALIILLLVLGGGGAFFFLQLKNKKKEESARPDPDADYVEDDDLDFDYPEDDEIPDEDGPDGAEDDEPM